MPFLRVFFVLWWSAFLLPAQEVNPPAGAVGSHEVVVPGFDLPSIMSALKRLPESGGTVFLPEGTYLLQGPVVLDRDNLTLKGAGPKTILQTGDSCDCPVLVMGSQETPPHRVTRNLTVRDLVLDGNRMMQKLECWSGECDTGGLTYIRNNCLTVRGVEDSRISRVGATRGRSGGRRRCSGARAAAGAEGRRRGSSRDGDAADAVSDERRRAHNGSKYHSRPP
jgi:hypothetical protein